MVDAFPQRIINIHPALLPRFGGKGMYGHHIHQAVIAASAKDSGITIHYVNAQYDEGAVILQAQCAVHGNDTPATLAARVLKLEHFYYPRALDFLLRECRPQPAP